MFRTHEFEGWNLEVLILKFDVLRNWKFAVLRSEEGIGLESKPMKMLEDWSLKGDEVKSL